jgi:hypothetical protein
MNGQIRRTCIHEDVPSDLKRLNEGDPERSKGSEMIAVVDLFY